MFFEGAEDAAAVPAAVAEAAGVFGVERLGYQTRFLGLVQYLQGLFPGDPAAHALVHVILGVGSEGKTHLQRFVAGLLQEPLLNPADTLGNRDVILVFEDFPKSLIFKRFFIN